MYLRDGESDSCGGPVIEVKQFRFNIFVLQVRETILSLCLIRFKPGFVLDGIVSIEIVIRKKVINGPTTGAAEMIIFLLQTAGTARITAMNADSITGRCRDFSCLIFFDFRHIFVVNPPQVSAFTPVDYLRSARQFVLIW